MKVKPTKALIALLASVLFLTLAGGLGLIAYQRHSLAATHQKLTDLQHEVAAGDNIRNRLAASEEALRADQLSLRNLELALPTYAYVPTLLAQLENLAQTTGNQVQGVRPEPLKEEPKARLRRRKAPDPENAEPESEAGKKPKGPYEMLPITIGLVGDYASVQDLIERLTHFPKILAVQQIEVKPHRDSSAATRVQGTRSLLDVKLRVNAFILDDGSTLATEPKAAGIQVAAVPINGEVQ